MRFIFTFTLILFVSLAAIAQEETTAVQFYRATKLKNSSFDCTIFTSDTKIWHPGDGELYYYKYKPGQLVVSIRYESKVKELTLDLKPGETQYVKVGLEEIERGPFIERVTSSEAKKDIYKIDPNFAQQIKVQEADKALKKVKEAEDEKSGVIKPEFGIKAGVNFASLSTSINGNNSSITTFHFGFYGRFNMAKSLFFRPEIYYSPQGQNNEFMSSPSGGTVVGNSTVKIDYLNIPLLFEQGRHFSFQFGPQLGFPLSVEETWTIYNTKYTITHTTKSPEISIVIGFGLYLTKHLQMAARLNYGTSNVFSTTSSPIPYPEEKNRVFHTYLSYSF